jgi:hypothetical protein
MPRQKRDKENEAMRRTLHNYLQRRTLISPPLTAGEHLDEDQLAAFTEGRLSEEESRPLTMHLVDCASCRRITARLVRLEDELGEQEIPASAPQEPGRIRKLLAELAARVVPSTEDTVFAYHSPVEDSEGKNRPKDGQNSDHNQAAEGSDEHKV